ncbi:hypothetical protein TNCT_174311, partial [Trichonephila clavata]
ACSGGQRTSSELQASEVPSLFMGKIKIIWRSPPEHAWYAAKCPGLSLQYTCPRVAQTTLSRLRTGHIKSLIFNGSEKTYSSCRCGFSLPYHCMYWCLCGAFIE